MFVQCRETKPIRKLLLSIIVITTLLLPNLGLNLDSLIFAEDHYDKAIDLKNTTNFFFHYRQYGGRFYPDEVSIYYSSNHKEIIYRDTRQSKYLTYPLDNTEEENLRKIIGNNGFFNFAVSPENANCSNCYIETLTVKLNNTSRTIRWNLTDGVVIPYAIFDTLRIINYVASK